MFELSGSELVGYLASALVVTSLTMTSVVRLRIISLVGSVTFVVYGVLIDSVPIIVTNALIACINVWFLRKEFAPDSDRGVGLGASRIRIDSPFLRDFVAFHLDDIHRFQPDFTLPADRDASGDRDPAGAGAGDHGDHVAGSADRAPFAESWLLTRDGLPAGLLIGRRVGTTLTVDLDYVLGPYRDSRLGQWLFGPGAGVFRHDGIDVLRSHGSTDTHRKYLERIGFRHAHDDVYELTL
ncbi:MAG: hypothetical protein ACE37B_15475 [Ilumatobacter sp.]|uniref:hypothetical protein n=1 Tax=Ilumatobacter sp. TaxID=1967498 RepID=UPI003919FC62